MNTIRLIPTLTAALALTASLAVQPASAQEATLEAAAPAVATTTRAQARVQGLQADGGEAGHLSAVPQATRHPISTAFKARAEQRALMAEVMRKGELPASNEFR